MVEYSGKVTAQHPVGFGKSAEDARDCISQVTLFDVQWTNCPVEVEDQVRTLWTDAELGNDTSYYSWNSESDGESYPVIDEYLKSRGVEKCLIHWWW